MERENKIDSLAGNEMIIVRAWHISVFTALISFVVLYVFFWSFQPTTLFEPNDFVVGINSNGVLVGQTKSDEDKDNKYFSDRGRTNLFAWSFGLGILVGLIIHLLLVFVK